MLVPFYQIFDSYDQMGSIKNQFHWFIIIKIVLSNEFIRSLQLQTVDKNKTYITPSPQKINMKVHTTQFTISLSGNN